MGLFRRTSPHRKAGSRRVSRTRLGVEALETRAVPYSATGNAWLYPQAVSISFVPDDTDLGGVSSDLIRTLNTRYSEGYWQTQILRAAQVWAQQTNINFVLVPDSGEPIGSGEYQQGSPSFGDIRIGGFDFWTSTLGQAFLPPEANNFSLAGDLQFNTAHSWVIGTTGGYDLFTVAAHEIGHALGLGHSSNYFSVMYPFYVGQRVALGADDIQGIRSIYSGGLARSKDFFDAYAANGSFATASYLDPYLDPWTLTALITDLDITTTADSDYYVFSVPEGTSGTLTVTLQSQGLSLLAPTLTVFNVYGQPVGYVSGAGQYGTTLTLTLNGVSPGEWFYLKAAGADSSPFGTGSYALALNFGWGDSPSIPLPFTSIPNGFPLQAGGALPERPGPDREGRNPGFRGRDGFPEGGTAAPRDSGFPTVRPDRNLVIALSPDSRGQAAEGIAGRGGPKVLAPGVLPGAPARSAPAAAPLLLPSVGSAAVLESEGDPERAASESPPAPSEAEAIPPPRLESEQGPAAPATEVPLRDACDACFAGPDWTGLGVGASDEQFMNHEDVGMPVDLPAAAAAAAVLLGAYGAAPPRDPDWRWRRRIND